MRKLILAASQDPEVLELLGCPDHTGYTQWSLLGAHPKCLVPNPNLQTWEIDYCGKPLQPIKKNSSNRE